MSTIPGSEQQQRRRETQRRAGSDPPETDEPTRPRARLALGVGQHVSPPNIYHACHCNAEQPLESRLQSSAPLGTRAAWQPGSLGTPGCPGDRVRCFFLDWPGRPRVGGTQNLFRGCSVSWCVQGMAQGTKSRGGPRITEPNRRPAGLAGLRDSSAREQRGPRPRDPHTRPQRLGAGEPCQPRVDGFSLFSFLPFSLLLTKSTS